MLDNSHRREDGERLALNPPMPYLPAESHTLLGERACCGHIALLQSHLSQEHGSRGNSPFIAYLPEERETFLKQRAYHRRVVLGNKEHLCEQTERKGNTPLISKLPLPRQILLEQRAPFGIVALSAGRNPQVHKRPGDASLVANLPGEHYGLLE